VLLLVAVLLLQVVLLLLAARHLLWLLHYLAELHWLLQGWAVCPSAQGRRRALHAVQGCRWLLHLPPGLLL
jgi:hypothetical protein